MVCDSVIRNFTLSREALFVVSIGAILFFPSLISIIFEVLSIELASYLPVFFGVMTITLISFNPEKIRNIRINRNIILLFIFFIYIFSSYLYTQSVIASKEKLTEIAYNTVLPIILLQSIHYNHLRTSISDSLTSKIFYRISYISLTLIILFFVLFNIQDESGRYSIKGIDNAIWFSRLIALPTIFLILYFPKPKLNKLFCLAVISLSCILLLLGGSRGPIIAILIILFVYYKNKRKSKGNLLAVLSIILFPILLIASTLNSYVFETNLYSWYARIEIFKLIQHVNFNYIFGEGIGSFGYVITGEDVKHYPHNIFVEIFFEFGFIGLLIFSILVMRFIRGFHFNPINIGCLFFLIASFVSGDIPGNNNFFILLYLSFKLEENKPK